MRVNTIANAILLILTALAFFMMVWVYINWTTSDEKFCPRVSQEKAADYNCEEYKWKTR